MLGFQALGRRALGQNTTDHAINAEVGAFELTGLDASLVKFVGVPAETGSFTLTGQDAALGRYLYANCGVFSVTGQTSRRILSINAAAASYTLTGQASKRALSIKGVRATFTLTGQTAGILAARVLYASPDTSVITNNHVLFAPIGSVAFGQGRISRTGSETTFAISAPGAGLRRAVPFVAEVGTFALTYPTSELVFEFAPNNIRAFPRVGRGPRGFGRGGKPVAAKAGSGGIRARAFGG